jgi:hypothetical protein
VKHPEEFFLRPTIDADKFPNERPIELSAEMQAKLHAQETAGRLVFQGDALPVQVAAEEKPAGSDQDTSSDQAGATLTGEDTAERYVQKPESPPTARR